MSSEKASPWLFESEWRGSGRRAFPGRTGCALAENARGPLECVQLSHGTGRRVYAEQGVRLAYQSAGLPPPEIVWCESPLALARTWACAAYRDGVGANARHIVFDRPYRVSMQRATLGKTRAASAREVFTRDPLLLASAEIQSAVIEEAGDIRPSLLIWMNRFRRSARWVRIRWRPAFADCGCGPRELLGAALVARVNEEVDGDASPALRGHRLIAENAGWFVPHEGMCWLSAPPDVLCTDRQGRLHCASGPALRYPDGWSVHVWKGTPVPAWIIMQPGRVTLQWIDAQVDPRIRHAMIDFFTPARFIAAGGAAATRDETGTLWKRKWTHRGVVIDSWAALDVAAEKGILRSVPPELGTPREAFIWLFGPGSPQCIDDHP